MNSQFGSIRLADPTRAQFDDSLKNSDVQMLVGNRQLRVLQCHAPVSNRVWTVLNESFFADRPDVELRVYGHYSDECDLSFARIMTNVRRFSADCLRRAQNINAIGEMPHLESLGIGIFELSNFEVLERVPNTLSELFLGATRSKQISLSPISRFQSLRRLALEGHSRKIHVLAELEQLEGVTLRSITTPDLSYLGSLSRLWSLDIKLGGIKSLKGIESKPTIKYLQLWQVRGLGNIEVVTSLPGLQNLFLQSLPHVAVLPRLAELSSLRRMVLVTMKGLSDLGALELAPSIEQFALLDGEQQTPEQLMPLLRNPSVRYVRCLFGSDRKNQAFAVLREQYAKSDWNPWQDFDYR